MTYLGKKNIVHRDLAARNILVASENHVKISDFGLAQVVEQNSYYILKTNRELPIKWWATVFSEKALFIFAERIASYFFNVYQVCSGKLAGRQILSIFGRLVLRRHSVRNVFSRRRSQIALLLRWRESVSIVGRLRRRCSIALSAYLSSIRLRESYRTLLEIRFQRKTHFFSDFWYNSKN